MSIQSSINQGILATAALVSQNPEFQEKKKEAAYEKKLEGTLEGLKKTGMQREAEINKAANEAIQSGDEQLLYNQLERFPEKKKNMDNYYNIKESKLKEAQEHYKGTGNLEKYSQYKKELEALPGKRDLFDKHYESQYNTLKHEYNKAQYRNEYLAYEETNKALDEAEQIQANTRNFHRALKNKKKINVVGERDGK